MLSAYQNLSNDLKKLSASIEEQIKSHLLILPVALLWCEEDQAEALGVEAGDPDSLYQLPSVLYVDKHGFADNYYIKSLFLNNSSVAMRAESNESNTDEVFPLCVLEIESQLALLRILENKEFIGCKAYPSGRESKNVV